MKTSRLVRLAELISLTFFLTAQVRASSATWNANPVNGDWNNASNWTPNTVPNGPADTATFSTSSITDISIGGAVELSSMAFGSGASTYTITSAPGGASSSLAFSGSGITNNFRVAENFVAATDSAGGHGTITFTGSSAPGGDMTTTFTNEANPVVGQPGGVTSFLDGTNAGEGTYTNEGGLVSGGSAGETDFFQHSSANQATIINNGSAVSGGVGGATIFHNGAQAYNASLIANGGTNGGGGGRIVFLDNTQGIFCHIHLSGNAVFDLSTHIAGFGIGSLDGDGGFVLLGGLELSLNSGTFAGVIRMGEADSPAHCRS
jgi:hypothetical protein